MTVLQPIRRFLLATVRAGWAVGSRHYLSFVSAAVLAGVAFLIFTSDSFESGAPSGQSELSATAGDGSSTNSTPRPRRPIVLFYLVNDDMQRDEIAAAANADRFSYLNGTPPVDYIIYLVAGTPEEESRTIERLNFEELAARQSGIEMRVIDVRGEDD